MIITSEAYWCQFSDVNNSYTFFSVSAILFLTLLLFLFTLYRLWKLVQFKVSRDVIVIHSLLTLWGIGISLRTQSSSPSTASA